MYVIEMEEEMIPAEYINKDGFVTIEKNAPNIPGEGNGWLMTGLAFACGMYRPDNVWAMYHSCTNLASDSPLIYRSPWKRMNTDATKCDDYWGALIMSETWAKQVLFWAEENGFDFSMFPEHKGNPEYRFDRFPSFIPFLKVCAGKKLTAWESLLYAGTILWDAFHLENADGNKKAFIRCFAAQDFLFGNLARMVWIWRCEKRWGTIGNSWAEAQPGHPINLYKGEK